MKSGTSALPELAPETFRSKRDTIFSTGSLGDGQPNVANDDEDGPIAPMGDQLAET
jgi:hypothetical protein